MQFSKISFAFLALQAQYPLRTDIAFGAQLLELEAAGGRQRDLRDGKEGAGGDQQHDEQRDINKVHRVPAWPCEQDSSKTRL